MNPSVTTHEAAGQARVTVATIRTWCRYGAVAATKVGRRWAIDTASLARRIALGMRRTRKARMATGHLSSKARTLGADLVVAGPAAELLAAFQAGDAVTIADGPFAGERVHLGLRRQTYGDHGITMETLGLDGPTWMREGIEWAAYIVDTDRLDDGAPNLAETYRRVVGERLHRIAEAEARQQAADDAYLNNEEY